MRAEMIGCIFGFLAMIGVIPYGIRVFQGKIHPNLTIWSLWTIIGLTDLFIISTLLVKKNKSGVYQPRSLLIYSAFSLLL